MSEELVVRFFAALEGGDIGTLREIYAPDAVIWHNDDLIEQPVEENLKVLQGLHRAVSGLRYEIIRRVPAPDGVLQQHVLRGQLAGGAEVELHAAMYLQVRDGHITRIEEYLDSGKRAAIRAAREALLPYVDPLRALRQIAFSLERAGAPTYRVRAFRRAAAVIEGLPAEEIARRVGDGTLSALPGIGPVTAQVITEAAGGAEPAYLTRLLGEQPAPPADDLRARLRGDCHTHSDWSDGGSPPLEMAEAARDLGHEWIALTDHSPRLTVASGLSAQRLRAQLELVRELNAGLAPFRILTGIEVDILEDGSLDQDPDLLGQLDVVVASVHSKLRMPAGPMTERMLAAVRNPHVDVLGHCTGRLLTGRGRPESVFDAAAVFAACREHGVAVEINCRPERMDPPDPLLRLADETGCLFAIDTDAHAPGQLAWLGNGTARAAELGVSPDRVINTRPAAEMRR